MTKLDLEKTVVFLFKARGGRPMTERDILMDMSMRRKWFTYSVAILVLEAMNDHGLLKKGEDGFIPALSIDEYDLPRDYRPDFDPLTIEKADPGTNEGFDDSSSKESVLSEVSEDKTEQTSKEDPSSSDTLPKETIPSEKDHDTRVEEIIESWGMRVSVIQKSKDAWLKDLEVGDAGALILAGYENGADVSDLIDWARKADSVR